MVSTLRLSRSQIAKIVGDDLEAIKQFEKLFTVNREFFDTGVSDATIVEGGSALAVANAAFGQASSFEDRIAALETAPPQTPHVRKHDYGSFYSTVDQTAALANTAYGMTFNATDVSFGVSIGSPASRIYVAKAGIYNIQFSAQIDTTVATDQLAWIWLSKNGFDVANSAGQIRTKGNNYASIAAWNYLLDMNAGDYFELMWAADSTGVFLNASAAGAFHPAIPSVILTVTNNISSQGD